MPERLGTAELSRSIFNPFPGLRAFEPEESYLYFGREQQTDELMRRLRGTHFLSVVGTSGSGKSSLVRAGLVPALHSGFMSRAGSSWRVAIMRPGGDPISNLAAALAAPRVLGEDGDSDGTGRAIIETALRSSSLGLAECVEVARIPEHDNVLIVVDQFEELFRFKNSSRSSDARDEAVAFVKLLLTAAAESARLYVVITMRSDFIGDCMELPRLPEAINEGQYLVPRMTRDELRRAITGPAGVRRGKISPRLVARLLNEVGDHPDQLPVLQHALMRMWALWEGSGHGEALDLVHYEEIGTMKEALSRHAEKAFGELESDREREIAERLFKALTDTERGGRGVRRPARLTEICDIAAASPREVTKVIDRFRLEGRSFLMPPMSVKLTPDTVIDLSHESLMRNWDRLVAWAKEEAVAAAMYRRLSRAAHRQQAGEAGLWRSPELDLGLRWREETRPSAAWAKRYDPELDRAIAFLEASVLEHDKNLARLERARRRKLQGWAAFIATVVLMLAGFLWYVDRERDRQRALSISLVGDDPLLAALVLSALPERLSDRIAGFFTDGRETAGELGFEFEAARRAAYAPIPSALFRAPGRSEDARSGPPLTLAAWSPNGEWLVLGTDGDAWAWRSDGKGDPIPLAGHDGALNSVAFSPSGDEIVTSSEDQTARVWGRVSSGWREFEKLMGHEGPVMSAAFSPDGDEIATSSKDGTVRVWGRSASGGWRTFVELADPQRSLTGAAFSPDGDKIVTTSSKAGAALLWKRSETDGWRLADVSFEGHGGRILSARFSPDGEHVLTTSSDATARLWTLDGRPPKVLQHLKAGKPVQVAAAAFDRRGDELVTAFFDGTALIWNVAGEPAVIRRCEDRHEDRLTAATFMPDGKSIVTASADGTAILWRIGEDPLILRGHVGAVNLAQLSEDGSRLVTAGQDGTARVWPLEAREPRVLGSHRNAVTSASFGPDGKTVASSSADAAVRIWSLGSEDSIELVGHQGEITSVAFSPTGEEIVTASKDKTARVWKRNDSGRWKEIARLSGHLKPVTSSAFSPTTDGEIVTSSEDWTARVWKRNDTGEWSAADPPLEGHRGPVVSASFSPDGNEIITASLDFTARIWKRDDEGHWSAATFLTSDVLGGKAAHSESLTSASFSSGGDMIVTSSTDGTARIWKRVARKPDGLPWSKTWSLEGHRAAVYGASFGPSGLQVVTSSKDGTARVWSTESGRELYALRVGKPVPAVRFNADGSLIVTGATDKTVRVWRVTESALKRYLKESSSVCLTVEERCWLLNESAWTARSRFEDCEKANGRTPPAELGSCR